MYEAHFGLREQPFGITPDTSFFFARSDYQEALNTLIVATRNGEGFIKVTGEVGTGKTLLCRKFMAMLDEGYVTAYIPNPMLEPRALMLALADELGITQRGGVGQHQLLKAINKRLLELAGEGKRVVLLLDEAQAMPLDTLEALRLLTNLETEKRKLLQIIMFGQPELDRKLEKEAIRQLKQRITFHYHLGPLARQDLESYLSHRLSVAGYQGDQLFDRDALRRLYLVSGGVPRMVNILAHKAMMLTYGQGRERIGAGQVMLAAADTGAVRPRNWAWLFGRPLPVLDLALGMARKVLR